MANNRDWSIQRRYAFEAAHFLPKVHDNHKCKRMHGHNYEFEVTVSGALDDRGWVLDFWDLDDIVNPIVAKLDHRLLNDIRGLENPTAEVIAGWLWDEIATDMMLAGGATNTPAPPVHITEIKVYETKNCCAIVHK